MAIKYHETEIDGVTWGLNTLPGFDGIEVLTNIMALAAEPLGRMVGGSVSSVQDLMSAELGADAMGAALGALGAKLGQPSTVAIVRKLLDGLVKDKKQVNFNAEFSANYGVLMQLLIWAGRINFESFFVGNPAIAGLLARGAQVPSPSTSTGGSGG